MLPPTCVGRCRRSISPTRAVVVLLPLEPVTPRTGAGQADKKRFISEVILARGLAGHGHELGAGLVHGGVDDDDVGLGEIGRLVAAQVIGDRQAFEGLEAGGERFGRLGVGDGDAGAV